MKKIVIYVSDHGYGHAARTIGLVRQLKQYNHEIIIKNSNAYLFLKSHLPDYKIIKTKTDVGPITNVFSNHPDYEKTFSLYYNWIKNETKWIKNEIQSFKNKKPDLIISDISPLGIKLANKLCIPSITIANFTWIDILENFPFHRHRDHILDQLRGSFEMTNLAIRLPLHMKLKGLKKPKSSSLLCRKVTVQKGLILKKLGIKNKPITVYLGTNNPNLNFITNNKSSNIIHVHPKSLKINNKKIKNSIEAQNLISASKLVVTKPGYSIFSECINSRCPMLIIPRKNYPEDEVLCRYAKKLGIFTMLDMSENLKIDLTNYSLKKLSEKIKEDEIQKIKNLPSTSDLISEFLSK